MLFIEFCVFLVVYFSRFSLVVVQLQKDVNSVSQITEESYLRGLQCYGMVGGKNTKISKYPYQAALLRDQNVIGSAVLLNKRWVLTTARNVQPRDHVKVNEEVPLSIRVGSNNPSQGGYIYLIDSIFIHPNFTGYSDNNIALIRVQNDIKTSRKVKFIQISDNTNIKKDTTVIGWGGQDELSVQYLKLNFINYNDCKNHYLYDEHFTNNSFCTAVLNFGPCKIDEGGPVVYNKKLIGIFSGTKVCGSIVYPAIYTNVTYYKNWIKSVISFK